LPQAVQQAQHNFIHLGEKKSKLTLVILSLVKKSKLLPSKLTLCTSTDMWYAASIS
jgi:hypothetical protein